MDILRFATLPLVLVLITEPGYGGTRYSSSYTDLTSCEPLSAVATARDDAGRGADEPRRCQGADGYEIVENYAAAGTYRQVVLAAQNFMIDLVPLAAECPFAFFADKVEWRLAEGVPFAVITRVHCYGAEPDAQGNYDTPRNRLGEYLMVRGLLGQSIQADIDVAKTAHANQHARQLADDHRAITSGGRPH